MKHGRQVARVRYVSKHRAIREAGPKDARGNAVAGDALLVDFAGSLIRAESRLVALLGVRDLAVVETTDAVLVAHGDRLVTRGGETRTLGPNESVAVPTGTVHRLRNAGGEPLEVVEVQVEDYLGEVDIVRLADDYGRAAPASDGPPCGGPDR